eukprot:127154-Rhodomonas_salina.1
MRSCAVLVSCSLPSPALCPSDAASSLSLSLSCPDACVSLLLSLTLNTAAASHAPSVAQTPPFPGAPTPRQLAFGDACLGFLGAATGRALCVWVQALRGFKGGRTVECRVWGRGFVLYCGLCCGSGLADQVSACCR